MAGKKRRRRLSACYCVYAGGTGQRVSTDCFRSKNKALAQIRVYHTAYPSGPKRHVVKAVCQRSAMQTKINKTALRRRKS